MKLIYVLLGLILYANANANIESFGKPAIDTRAPGYFARAIGRSEYVVIPVYDSAHRSMHRPVIVRDRAKLDELALLFEHAVFQPTSDIFAVLAGGPITFHAADNHVVLAWEPFGDMMRLNYEAYRIDKKSAAALHDWLKKAQDNQAPDRTAPSVTPPASASEELRRDKAQEPRH